MILSIRWVATATVAIALGMEPLVASAAMLENLPQTSASTISVMTNQPTPVLLAKSSKQKTKKSTKRRPRLNRRTKVRQTTAPINQSVVDAAAQLELEGRRAADECILNERADECNRLSTINNSLYNLCFQNPSQICSNHLTNLSTYEAYLHSIKALRTVS
jgi:hypothetical protein